MRTFRRRAAVGATSLALLLAAGGTSLAAVRAARYEGGVTGTNLALPVPDGSVTGTVPLPPTAGLVEGIDVDALPAPSDPAADPAAGPAAAPPGSPPAPPGGPTTGTSSTSPTTGATAGAGASVSSPQRAVGTVGTLGPATGPTPTAAPQNPTPTTPCPSDTGPGTLQHAQGRLRAPDLWLPSPGPGPLVLIPQATATRPAGSAVSLRWSSLGSIGDGSNLTLVDRLPTRYRLEAGGISAEGLITFTPLGATFELAHRACRDRSLVVHAIAPTPGVSQLRIVGYLAPAGTVTIDDGGGAARFRSSSPGRHQVTLLTANDAGFGGPLVRVTITVS